MDRGAWQATALGVAKSWTQLSNLGSILKSKDITLPTNARTVKAMVFPVVLYGCEIWTIKKAECQRIHAFVFVFFFLNFKILNSYMRSQT